MSGFNPRTPWSELERRLSDRAAPDDRPVSVGSWGRADRILPDCPTDTPPDSSASNPPDSPPQPPRPPAYVPAGTPYAELHVHSDFSFLDGASEPEELVETAVAAGLAGLALTDHNGLYGAPRFAAAAAESGLPTVFGSELSIGLTDRIPGQVDPAAAHLLVLARGGAG
jgi:error-prone DNA polymerase